MATLEHVAMMKLATATLAAIDAATLRNADQADRPHLGASQIGKACERALWYGFRWVSAPKHGARILRLFARGQREEDVLSTLLRDAGATVHQIDARTGQQYRFSVFGGHFGGSMDGACVDLPDAPKTWHVVEFKTHSAKSFRDLTAKGVQASKFEHWVQMQCYMHWTGMERALYMAVCKDNDELHLERVDYDKAAAERAIDRAERIVFAAEPPARIGDASWWECKFCEHRATCHGTADTAAAPRVNCRTCAHATPEPDGTWSCARHNLTLGLPTQREGCQAHRYTPALLHWAAVVDANHDDNWVKYELPTGATFTNGQPPAGLASAEIASAASPEALGQLAADPFVQQMRTDFGGEFVEVSRAA